MEQLEGSDQMDKQRLCTRDDHSHTFASSLGLIKKKMVMCKDTKLVFRTEETLVMRAVPGISPHFSTL